MSDLDRAAEAVRQSQSTQKRRLRMLQWRAVALIFSAAGWGFALVAAILFLVHSCR